MTILGLASRAELRRLHQTIHRNLSRQHRQQTRHESSNTNSKHHASSPTDHRTIPTPFWTILTPLTRPFKAYTAMQTRRPLLIQFESSLIIYFLGDLSAQTLSSDTPYEPIRGLRALVIAAFISIPGYKYFLWLGNHFNYRSKVLSIVTKVVVNQTFFTPVFNTYFFGMQCLLSGSSWAEARRRVVETVPVSWKNSW